MSGYAGYSKSNNALAAEADGKYPLTQAVAILSGRAEITKKAARAIFEAIGHSEWHHTSKYYNRTLYYSVDAALYYLDCAAERSALANFAGKPADLAAFAISHGLDVDKTENAYYGCYDPCDR